jgi:flagellar L-ring protein precursor FlgH
MMNTMKNVFVGACLLLSACTFQKTEVKTPTFDEQMPPPAVSYAKGSIWQASSAGLVDDHKARRKGDIVTILIAEQASASKQASTGTSRKASTTAGIPKLMGLETSMTGIRNWMDLANLISASSESKFDGTGSTTRNENLSATITAKVVEVLPNGNLMIAGRRNVLVNNEDQLIVVEGTVRSRDISPDNIVSSAQVADARITYSGNGVVSDQQKPGWLTTIFGKIWPF